jgi:hypothetical protein
VPPPELARYAPGLDVLEPLEVGLLPALGDDASVAFAHRREGALGERLHVDVPLVGEIGLDRHVGAVAMRDHVDVRLDLLEVAVFFQERDDALTRLEAVEPIECEHRVEIGEGGEALAEAVVGEPQPGFRAHDVDKPQPVPAPDLEIVEVVRRRDLDRAGALLGIGICVGDDRDAPPDERQDGVASDQIPVALVVGMHGDAGVAEHGLRPRRRDRDEAALLALDRIADVPEAALYLDLHDLEVGDRGLEARVPVHEALVAVDEPVAVELDEDLDHRARQALVHGEPLARPVAGGAEAAELSEDRPLRFLFLFPDLAQEGLPAHGAAVGPVLGCKPALDHHLGRDAGVVGAGLPQDVLAAHALEAAEHVLERVVEGVAHVQRARHVRRRDDDAIGLRIAALRPARPEGASLLPTLSDARLDGRGIEGLVHHDGRLETGAAGGCQPEPLSRTGEGQG